MISHFYLVQKMQVTLLKSKLHRAQVTGVHQDYSGSLSIDQDLLDAAGFLHHEKILVGNITNGERFETYCIPAPRGSGEIALNGAAAHKGKVGDLLVIITFVTLNPDEAAVWEPKLVLVGKDNLKHEIVSSPAPLSND